MLCGVPDSNLHRKESVAASGGSSLQTSCGGSRHSARGPHHAADPDIQLGENLICFPVSHVYFFVGGGQSLYLNWTTEAIAGFALNPPLVAAIIA